MKDYIADTIKAVLFDHDDTLVETRGPKWEHHRHVARTWYGRELSDEDLREHWGKPLSQMARLLYGTEDIETALARLREVHTDFPKILLAPSIDVLQAVHDSGRKTGIITATNRFNLDHDIASMNFPVEAIDYTQTEEDTPYHKPDSRVFDPAKTWLAEQGISPDETLYIGDGLHDMNAALGAGFHFLGTETGLVDASGFQRAGARSIAHLGMLLPT